MFNIRFPIALLFFVLWVTLTLGSQCFGQSAIFRDPKVSDNVISIALQSDAKILICGIFSSVGGQSRRNFARLNPNGTLDASFPTLSPNDTIRSIAVQDDGKIIVGGSFTFISGQSLFRVARFNPDGSIDAGFQNPAVGSGSSVDAIAVQPDGKILIGGSFTNVGGQSHGGIARLNSDGSLDATFNVVTTSYISTIHLLLDGRIFVAGAIDIVDGQMHRGVARLLHDGSLDESFGDPAVLNQSGDGQAKRLLVQSNGQVLIAGGGFTTVGGETRSGVTRLNSDGSFDPSYLDQDVSSITIQNIAQQENGGVVLVGNFASINQQNHSKMARLNIDGSLDETFPNPQIAGSTGQLLAVAVQSDSKLLIGGNFTTVGNRNRQHVARFTNGGVLEAATPISDFDADEKTDISVFRPSTAGWYLRRSQAGLLGVLFGNSEDNISPCDFDGDGKTDIAVYRPSTGIWYIFNSSNGTVTYNIFGLAEDLPTPADYDGDGKADISVFRPSTATWYRQNSSDGSFYGQQFGLPEDKPTVGDFDGDGKADIAIFRPSLGDWYQFNSSDGSVSGARFGFGTDVIVPADYDGDGKTDLAVYRPSTGIWYINNSSSGDVTYNIFGLADDIPAPGDFDGDGKADVSVFRPSTGTWYRQNSSDGSFFAYEFGTAGDKPTQTAFLY